MRYSNTVKQILSKYQKAIEKNLSGLSKEPYVERY